MLTTGNQLRAARALVDMDQGTLAERAGVNINTIGSMERRGAQSLTSGLDKVRAVMVALETAGVEFLNHGQPGVRLNVARLARNAADALDQHTGGNPDPKRTARRLRRFADERDP